MKKLVVLIQLYSVQVLAVLAAANAFVSSRPDVPWWMVLLLNVVGVLVGMVVRDIPQPQVAAKLAALRTG